MLLTYSQKRFPTSFLYLLIKNHFTPKHHRRGHSIGRIQIFKSNHTQQKRYIKTRQEDSDLFARRRRNVKAPPRAKRPTSNLHHTSLKDPNRPLSLNTHLAHPGAPDTKGFNSALHHLVSRNHSEVEPRSGTSTVRFYHRFEGTWGRVT